jgi:hypothetical protein
MFKFEDFRHEFLPHKDITNFNLRNPLAKSVP